MIKCIRNWMAAGLCFWAVSAGAQEKPERWDLQTCIAYARRENIQIRQSRIALDESLENVKEAKSQLLPSLGFTSAQNYINRPRPESGSHHTYSGSYNLNASVALYQGGRLKKNLQQLNVQNEVQELSVEEAENNIELAITRAFVQVLYANETVKINANTVEVSGAQRDRGKELMDAGALSKADFAQLESQYMSDKYQLVVARTALENARLDLKQLLELDVNDRMELDIPDLSAQEVLALLPSKEMVCQTSLQIMPEVKYHQLNIEIAGIQKQKVRAGFLPTLGMSAGLGSGHTSGTGWSFGSQMKQNWSENVGLTLSIPVFNNRSARTAVNLAQLGIENAELSYEGVRKDLLKSVENVYQDAVSAQERFRAAMEHLKAVELSFELTQEQFYLGMKNTLEMLTEKNNYSTAQQELIQAKYTAVLNIQLLNFYQGKEIAIK